jgi:hypothetical protein
VFLLKFTRLVVLIDVGERVLLLFSFLDIPFYFFVAVVLWLGTIVLIVIKLLDH